jgi:hypothetical protein
MPSTVLDSDIFKDMFGTPEMRAVFSDDNLLESYIKTEVALAIAQGRTGVIPPEAADAIAKAGATVTLERDLETPILPETSLTFARAQISAGARPAWQGNPPSSFC